MGKGTTWLPHEDLQLARSWVALSEDPDKGKDQAAGKFWSALHLHWCHGVGVGSADKGSRSVQALKNHWSFIQRSTQKFTGYWNQVEARQQSGKTDADLVSDAMQVYLDIEKEAFQHESKPRQPNFVV